MTPAERLRKNLELSLEDRPSTQQVGEMLATLIKQVASALDQAKKSMKSDVSSTMKDCMAACEACSAQIGDCLVQIESGDRKVADEAFKQLNRAIYSLEQQIKNIPQFDPGQMETQWTMVVHEINAKLDAIKPYLLQATEVRDALEGLSGEDRLDASAIKGLEKLVKNKTITQQIVGQQGIQLSVDSVLKGISKYVNLVSGPGITLTTTITGDSAAVTVSASAGGSPETPSGVVDGSNTVFTFVASPKVIIVDQARTLIVNHGFTLVGLVATLDVAPVNEIYSI